MELRSSEGYQKLTPDMKARICNGCGAKGMFDFIPDTMYGMKICEACNIHDYDYFMGKTISDKHKADLRFLGNLIILVNKGNVVLRFLRRRRALKYYEAVRELGDKAFWAGKEKP